MQTSALLLALVVATGCGLTRVQPGKPIEPAEAAGGVVANIGLRILPRPWNGPIQRFLLFSTGSLSYELFFDPHHNDSYDQARWDARDRLVGYLVTEGVWALVTAARKLAR